jgi:hypothetical protein
VSPRPRKIRARTLDTPPIVLRYFAARGRAQHIRYYLACRGLASVARRTLEQLGAHRCALEKTLLDERNLRWAILSR